jgi:hypothetical protein
MKLNFGLNVTGFCTALYEPFRRFPAVYSRKRSRTHRNFGITDRTSWPSFYVLFCVSQGSEWHKGYRVSAGSQAAKRYGPVRSARLIAQILTTSISWFWAEGHSAQKHSHFFYTHRYNGISCLVASNTSYMRGTRHNLTVTFFLNSFIWLAPLCQ